MEVEGGVKLIVVWHLEVVQFGGIALDFVLLGVEGEEKIDEKADEGGDSVDLKEGGEVVGQKLVAELSEFLDVPSCSNSGWFEGDANVISNSERVEDSVKLAGCTC